MDQSERYETNTYPIPTLFNLKPTFEFLNEMHKFYNFVYNYFF